MLAKIVRFLRQNLAQEKGENMMEKVEMKIPQILITRVAFDRLCRFIDLCPTEIAGLGKLRQLGADLEIYDIFILPQRVTAASAIIEPDAIAQHLVKMVENDQPTQDIGVWWHSHSGMGVFWSGVDIGTADAFQTDYMVGILGNRRHDFTCRLDIYQRFRVWATGLPLVCPDWDRLNNEVQAEIKRNVVNPYGRREF